jgi:hypothetical protein
MVKDIQQKLGEKIVDTTTIESSLKDIVRAANTLASLQNHAQDKEYAYDIEELGKYL